MQVLPEVSRESPEFNKISRKNNSGNSRRYIRKEIKKVMGEFPKQIVNDSMKLSPKMMASSEIFKESSEGTPGEHLLRKC